MTPVLDLDAAQLIRESAGALGFRRVRFASLAPEAPGVAALDAFLNDGRQGDMAWLARGRSPRADPTQLLPGARSAVVLGVDHAWPRPPDPGGLTGKVASYAWGRDYHNLVGKRLQRLVRQLRAARPGLGLYGGVDSRPLMERAWAERAGLGFIGRNATLIVPGEGSFLFLAVILVDVELPPDPPIGGMARHCGSCRACHPACPTDAFTGDGQLDARRCISYLTIELRGAIPEELRPGLGRWVFGCDLCQEVCPHNHGLADGSRAPGSPGWSVEPDLAPRPERAWLDLAWVLEASDEEIDARLMGSPLRRARPEGLKRNAAVVLGNLGDPAARGPLEVGMRHPSAVVQEHARWALERIGA